MLTEDERTVAVLISCGYSRPMPSHLTDTAYDLASRGLVDRRDGIWTLTTLGSKALGESPQQALMRSRDKRRGLLHQRWRR
jgi:hypothetical protein